MANTCDFLSQGQGSNPCASTKTLENGVIGNTRDFDSLVLSSNLGSRTIGHKCGMTHAKAMYKLKVN